MEQGENLFPGICPDMPELHDMICVRAFEDLHYWLDSVANHVLCGTVK